MMLALGACGRDSGKVESQPSPPKPPKVRSNDWRDYISDYDRDRLARWRAAWIAGLDKASKNNKAAVAAQGPLLKPDFALDDPLLPEGDYRCRVIKMGAQTGGKLDYVAYPYFTCRIATYDGRLRFTKVDGSQRPVGEILPDDGRRMIFLGSMMLGDETRPLPYGRDNERDMVGIVERVDAKRWRIAFPYPQWESMIDVVELLPKDPG